MRVNGPPAAGTRATRDSAGPNPAQLSSARPKLELARQGQQVVAGANGSLAWTRRELIMRRPMVFNYALSRPSAAGDTRGRARARAKLTLDWCLSLFS